MAETPSDTVAVRCVADGKVELITNAVLKEWKQCRTCSYIICKECLVEFLSFDYDGTGAKCPGSTFRRGVHKLDVGEIRLDEILKIVQKKQLRPAGGILLERAFYSRPKIQKSLEDSLDTTMVMSLSIADGPGVIVRQEEWSSMGSVIVKRNRGKYVMWERLTD